MKSGCQIDDTLFVRMHGCLSCESGFWGKLGNTTGGWGVGWMDEGRACCMLRVCVCGSFLGVVVCCCMSSLFCMATGRNQPTCCLRSACPWLRACPTLIHTQEHAYVHTPTLIVLPCLLSLVPNAHVQRYTQWMPAEWDRVSRRSRLFASIRWLFHWFYLVYTSVDREPPER